MNPPTTSTNRDATDVIGLDEVVRSFPVVVEQLQTSYRELEERAARVDRELCEANRALEHKVRELDVVKQHLEAVLEALPCGVVVRNAAGEITRVNGAALSILGLRTDELVGAQGHAALIGEPSDGEPREVAREDGRRLVLASNYSTVRTSDDQIDGSVEILDDRTEQVALSERLHASDKMAALGTMAAGIAHEIRNPLSAVKGFAEMLETRSDTDERAKHWTQLIAKGVKEADAIIENMLSFGSPERLRTEVIEGEALLEGAIQLALAEGKANQADCVETESTAPPFIGDHIKLRQAVRNLVANALDAQEENARVVVHLRKEGESIVLRVADAGPGVSAELRRKVFDPFFTTHADGTGLGLPLVSTIAQLHGGEVSVSQDASALGGAEFVIRIPYQPALSTGRTQ